jgi:alkaline phosphatase
VSPPSAFVSVVANLSQGYYQTKLQLDQFPVIGHQMTHSIDSYITDSANSASALYSGHKSTVNAMG